jgi:hypothetical protein
MKYNLFLDDTREPNKFLKDTRTWLVVRNYNQFVETIAKQGLPDFISFDHDLADEHYNEEHPDYDKFKEKTGYDCAKWLVEYCMKTSQSLPEWQVHSMNPIGRMNINMILSMYKDKEEDIHE